MADDTIEIEFQLTADDLLAFSSYACKRFQKSCNLCFLARALVYLVAIAFVVSSLFFSEYPVFTYLLLGMLIGISIFSVLISYISKLTAIKSISDPQHECFDKKTLILSPSQLIERSERVEKLYRWNAFRSVEKTKDYAYIFSGSQTAFIFPKRTFDTDNAYDEFCEQCVAWHKAALDAEQGEGVTV